MALGVISEHRDQIRQPTLGVVSKEDIDLQNTKPTTATRRLVWKPMFPCLGCAMLLSRDKGNVRQEILSSKIH